MTVVEVLVALLVFSLGALGSAAALSVAARTHAVAAAKREALDAARRQRVALTTTPCANLVSGGTTLGAARVTWIVTYDGSLASIALRSTVRGATVYFSTAIACP